MEQTHTYERYQRQILLPQFGREGQDRLLQARVLMIGAGGLGCPLLQYLAAAGVGTIGIVDDDVVSLNNLHRQVLYTMDDIGHSKAERAARLLARMNPDICIIPYNQRLTTKNAVELFRQFELIIDGTDNFATRYLINDACVLLNKPLIYGAINQYEGQVSVFNYPQQGAETPVNYRDLFAFPPKEHEVLNCAEAGVLGVLPGIIGSMMANEAIKILSRMGEVLSGRLLTYNALNNDIYILSLSASEKTRSLIPADEAAFVNTDYVWLCSSPAPEGEIDNATFEQLRLLQNTLVIDVREPDELPAVTAFPTLQIPLRELAQLTDKIVSETVIIFCQSGKRSLQAAKILSGIFGETKKIYSLKGGIVSWKAQHETKHESNV